MSTPLHPSDPRSTPFDSHSSTPTGVSEGPIVRMTYPNPHPEERIPFLHIRESVRLFYFQYGFWPQFIHLHPDSNFHAAKSGVVFAYTSGLESPHLKFVSDPDIKFNSLTLIGQRPSPKGVLPS